MSNAHWTALRLDVGTVFSEPTDEALAAVDSASLEGARVWSNYLATWTAWNHVRTATALAAAASLIAGR